MIITDEKVVMDLAAHLVMRIREIYDYDSNIANYRKILESLPTEYPARLEGLKGMDPITALQNCPIEDIELLSKLHQYERINFLIRTEISERTKAESLRAAVEAQLDDILDDEQKELVVQQAYNSVNPTQY